MLSGNCERPRQMEDPPSCSWSLWPPGLPQKGKKERCLWLGSLKTDYDPKICVQEVQHGEFSGRTSVRKRGKQDWVEGEVASEASITQSTLEWGQPFRLVPNEKRRPGLCSIISGCMLPLVRKYNMVKVVAFGQNSSHRGTSGSVLKRELHHDIYYKKVYCFQLT